MITKNKIRGMFIGIAVGDSIGLAVEGCTAEKIADKYGRITNYIKSDRGNLGCTSDDLQLSLKVAEGLIEAGFNMDVQAKKHIEAYQVSTAGWGRTTKTAVRNLQNGADWRTSGVDGVGNGVAMKIAPVAAYLQACVDRSQNKRLKLQEGFEFIRNLTLMTHRTKIALSSTVGIVAAIYKCFEDDLDIETLPGYILKISKASKEWLIGEETDDVVERFALLSQHAEYDTARLIAEFGGGSCYCYNSIPFALMFFLNNPHSIDALYDCVNAGGDTDSNCSMLGAMLGALNGEEIFPKHLIDGLDGKDHILKIADKFFEAIQKGTK